MRWRSSPLKAREIATQALELIEVELEPQPVISDPVQARQPGEPQLHPNGNLLKHIKVRKGDIEQGFAEAEVILEHTFHTATTDHAFLEPECSIARLAGCLTARRAHGNLCRARKSRIPIAARWRVPWAGPMSACA